MKKIFLIIILLILSSCSKDFSFYLNKKKIYNFQKINTTDFAKNPDNYTNRQIEMSGTFYIDFENIYLIVDDKKVHLDFNFYQQLKTKDGALLDGKKLQTFNGSEIIVKGKYVDGISGHLGCCNGKLTEIVYFGSL